jgi:type I restriction enzyme S subunit
MPMFSIDDKKVLPELFNYFLKSSVFKDRVQELTQTGSAQKAIHERELLELAFSFPSSVIEQKKLAKKIDSRFIQISKINQQNELDRQYVSQLKQAILQEAIAGQLTVEWRTQNPMQNGNPDTDAAALLAKIKSEKQQAIADGKLKKEKPLAEIAIDEIPFSIPDNWVWCSLVEIAEGFEYGSSTKSLDSGKVPVLRMGNLQSGLVDFKNLVYTNDDDEIEQYALSYGDLLFNRTNSRELVGKTSLFLCNEKMIYAGYLVRYKMLGTISFHYANYVMNSQLHRDWCYAVKIDAIGQSNINATKLRSFPFPLPPLAEQKAIVEKCDRLMNIIDQLEQQIKHRKQLAENLMQTVLREAFE